MSKQGFLKILKQEVERVDSSHTTKRKENIIEDFTDDPAPKAIIDGKKYSVFNSNDYLGLRHHPALHKAEVEASTRFGTGPGAVRFISGSLKTHRDLEKAIAKFHDREDSMVISSAFATNLAVLFSLIKGQSRDSLVGNNVLVVSDALNHRSIIDGIRLANLPKDQRVIFKHLDAQDLEAVLEKHVGKVDRVVVVTDGIFSMLGEHQDIKKIKKVVDNYDEKYPQGLFLIVDDAHGVASFGQTGRGTEEVSGAKADVLVGTFGKGFGADGGYVVANKVVIDYLRESGATYIYSNSFSPGTAGAALKAIEILGTDEGTKLLTKLRENTKVFKAMMKKVGFEFAANSNHPIQPILIGDTAKTKELTQGLFDEGFLVTNINYPVVAKGKDEIRVQISAAHTSEDIEAFLKAAEVVGKKVGVIG